MLGSVLFTIVAFLVAITVLIAVHEFGHFWVAKRLGVKVLRYSIGFGKPLWTWRAGADRTEYMVAAVPLGGYVKMLDEREGVVPPAELGRAFNRQTVWRRFAIVFAGPGFNFLFAIIAYWLVFVVGVTGVRPVIGEVQPDTPAAQAGLQAGDEIVAVQGAPTPIWEVALQEMLPQILDRESVQLTVRRDGQTREAVMNLAGVPEAEAPAELFGALGLQPWRPRIEPVVGQVLSESPAERAGLQPGDRILRVAGTPVEDWQDLVEAVQQNPERTVELTVEREGETRVLAVKPQPRENGEGVQIGITPGGEWSIPEAMQAEYRYPLGKAIGESVAKTWDMSVLTVKLVGKIITGEASVRNLSGPINIAVYAGQSASAGAGRFLDFLAIVSISLGILNLLPIPILDGGHLLYYLIEMVKGSPVSEQTEAIGQRIGIFILILLMSLALYNDLIRLLG